jgi:hypothetical protein
MRTGHVGFIAATLTLATCAWCLAQQPPAPPPAPGQPPAAPSGPAGRIEISPKEFNFGEIWQNVPAKKEFTVKNVGPGPLTMEMTSTCGCTVPTNPKSPLPPGETTQFTITFDARAAGDAHKTVTIKTNDPVQPMVPIEVTGKVKPVFVFTPTERIIFEGLEPGSAAATQTLKLTNKYDKPVHLKLKTEGVDFTSFDAKLDEKSPGQEYELTATTKPPLKMGQNRVLLTLIPDVKELQPLTVYVFASVQPRVFPVPLWVTVDEKETKPSDQFVTVMYRLDKETPALKVTDVKCDLPGFKFIVLPAEQAMAGSNQGSVRVRVTVPGYQDIPEAGTKLTIITDDKEPAYQKLEIEVKRRVNMQVPPSATQPQNIQLPPGMKGATSRPVPVPVPAGGPGGH